MLLYDAPDCWKCVEVKQSLDALGLEYEAVTVRGDPEARAALVALQGEPPLVPMLVDGDLAVWDRRRILAYLDQTYGAGTRGETSFRDMPVFMGGVCAIGDPRGLRVSTIVPLTGASRFDLPPPCVSCVFWQDHRAVTDERRKEAWTESFSRRHGAFGRVLHEGARFRGMIQYGPSGAFPRALGLPAGPPGRDAALVTCTYLAGEDPGGACERLMLEALADLKAQAVVAVEAFALTYPEEVPPEDRFLGHHTLLDRDFLEGLGFSVVRTHGQVALMRIGLGGLIPGPRIVERARRLGERLLEAPVRPAPA